MTCVFTVRSGTFLEHPDTPGGIPMRRLFVFFLIILIPAALYAEERNVGVVSDIEGEVSVVRNGVTRKAGIGMYIEVGDRIVTYADSRVKIMMMDDSLLSIAPKTEFSIDEYFIDRQKKHRKSLIGLIRGKIMFYVNKAFSMSGSKFEVRTKTSIAGVRGTKFFYECEEGEVVGVLEGEVELVSKDKNIRITDGKCADSRKDFALSQLDTATLEQYNGFFRVKKGKMQVAMLSSGTRTGGEQLIEGYYQMDSLKGGTSAMVSPEPKTYEGAVAEGAPEDTVKGGDFTNRDNTTGGTGKDGSVTVGNIYLRLQILLPFVKVKR
jgi:hypothetical protein